MPSALGNAVTTQARTAYNPAHAGMTVRDDLYQAADLLDNARAAVDKLLGTDERGSAHAGATVVHLEPLDA